jgi:16S rRNA (uracil1498-N3)-methyltransferase
MKRPTKKMARVLLADLIQPHAREIDIPDAEAKHLVQVYRLRTGDLVQAIDGHGSQIQGHLVNHGKGWCIQPIAAPVKIAKENEISNITVYLAILKGDAMEWSIEKCVELGVNRLVPVITKNTVVDVESKGAATFVDRWQKIANQALKQCERHYQLEISNPLTFEWAMQQHLQQEGTMMFWADEAAGDRNFSILQAITANPVAQTAVFIGPEGGFDITERERFSQMAVLHPNQLCAVSLGPLILRAETACLYAVSLLRANLGSGKL